MLELMNMPNKYRTPNKNDYYKNLIKLTYGTPCPKLKDLIESSYIDTCRTLHGISIFYDEQNSVRGDKKQPTRNNAFKNNIISYIDTSLHALTEGSVSFSCFDKSHEKICKNLVKKYSDYKYKNKKGGTLKFTYGHAQKWINMTLKNIFIAYYTNPQYYKPYNNLYRFCHLPLDSTILELLIKGGIIVEDCLTPWSKINCYKSYLDLQKKIRKVCNSSCIDKSPLTYEFHLWLNSN